jgi:hypothetical protein
MGASTRSCTKIMRQRMQSRCVHTLRLVMQQSNVCLERHGMQCHAGGCCLLRSALAPQLSRRLPAAAPS